MPAANESGAMSKAAAMAEHPDFPWLFADDTRGVTRLLRQAKAISSDEHVASSVKAGDGNMNLTLRVRIAGSSGERCVIVKQSRPWVEKYETIAAPWDRAISEYRFYQRVAGIAGVADRMPQLLATDATSRLLVLEDLGESRDFSGIYSNQNLPLPAIAQLAQYLRALHEATRGRADPLLANRAMRELNHQHMYVIPIQADNGLVLEDFEPSLPAAARELREDDSYLRLVAEIGERYLSDGKCLLHGDYFPGSWLTTDDGLRVIDPEFCFFGDPEFDVGVCIAHLRLARRPWSDALAILESYGIASIDRRLLSQYSGCEVMRRLIGYAQLPLPPGEWRADLLRASSRCVQTHNVEELWT